MERGLYEAMRWVKYMFYWDESKLSKLRRNRDVIEELTEGKSEMDIVNKTLKRLIKPPLKRDPTRRNSYTGITAICQLEIDNVHLTEYLKMYL